MVAKRARRSEVDDEDVLPANYVAPPKPWANDNCDAAREVREILAAFEVRERRADTFRTPAVCLSRRSLA